MTFKYALAAVTALSLTALTTPAQAALINIPLTFDPESGNTSSGEGFFTIDDSNLAPNILLDDLSDLENFSATFTNLSSIPSTTTFSLSDLSDWIYRTDDLGNIVDVNFFMGAATNTDGYRLQGSGPLFIQLSGNGELATYDITPGTPVPEPSTILGASVALAFGKGFKRKLAKKK
ncbi:MAG: PEP-CTERM sorting domain-containing protein [Crocosphaera sp.]|nr:PEP-CTERM sorting domain-containing protein [Crocosphaera sp.]